MLIVIGVILLMVFAIWLLPRLIVVIHMINTYDKAIEELSKIDNRSVALEYLREQALEIGICYYLIVHKKFSDRIWFKFIERYNPRKKKGFIYWYINPGQCDNVEEMKETLVLRRDRLKYILKRLTIFP